MLRSTKQLRLCILPKDTNTLVLVGLESTILESSILQIKHSLVSIPLKLDLFKLESSRARILAPRLCNAPFALTWTGLKNSKCMALSQTDPVILYQIYNHQNWSASALCCLNSQAQSNYIVIITKFIHKIKKLWSLFYVRNKTFY